MTEIIKSRAITLRKLDYGDTSKIAHFYTEEFGRISAIIKGARSPKSKIGIIIDVFNLVEIVFYQKDTREVQLVSQADLISHFPRIKDDLERLKYATAIIELISVLTHENDTNKRLFKGVVRILELLNENSEKPKLLFVKFFIFFIKEIGYELQLKSCSNCRKELLGKMSLFSHEEGFLCPNCGKDKLISFEFTAELFNKLSCLNMKKINGKLSSVELDKIIFFLERYLKYHLTEFKGVRSLHVW